MVEHISPGTSGASSSGESASNQTQYDTGGKFKYKEPVCTRAVAARTTSRWNIDITMAGGTSRISTCIRDKESETKSIKTQSG